MNDDLNLIVTYVSKSKTLEKVFIKVEHGMNLEDWCDDKWKFYKKPTVAKLIKDSLPLYVSNHIDFIVDVESIFASRVVEYEA